AASLLEHDVVRRDRTVHDIVGPRPLERVVHLLENAAHALRWYRSERANQLRERRAAHTRPHDREGVVAEPAPLDDRNDVRVTSAREQLGVGGEKAKRLVVAARNADDVDRNVTIESGVAREKGPAILGATELAQDLISIVELAEIWSELRFIRHTKSPEEGVPARSCSNYAQLNAFRSSAPRERRSASHTDR